MTSAVTSALPLSALSVVIPVLNEEGAIRALLGEIAATLARLDFEVIVVDDGSTDGTPAILAALAAASPWLRVIRHPARAGQSSAIRSGVRAARHDWVATLDGDGQNPPGEIPRLMAALAGPRLARVGLVQGQRAARRDGWSKRAGSRIANGLRASLLRDGVRDSGCGMKLFRRAAYLEVPFFDHLHRFLPAMMRREGWEVLVVDVGHRPRLAGASKYGNLQRALVGLVDLAGAAWLIRRQSPLSRLPSPAEPAAPRTDGQLSPPPR